MQNISEVIMSGYNFSEEFLDSLLSDRDNVEAVDDPLCQGSSCRGEKTTLSLGTAGIISLLLGSVSIVFNMLSLLVITQIKQTITTHFRLIGSLACSDLLMGVSVVCHHMHRVTLASYLPGHGPIKEHLVSRCLFMLIKALNSTSLLTTLFNLLGMAIDHYIAVMKPFHYQRLLRRLRGCCMIVCFWLLGALLGFSDFYIESWEIPKIQRLYRANFCEAIWITRYQEEYWVFGSTFITGISIVCIYIQIYKQIRLLQRQELTKVNPGCGVSQVLRRSFYRQRRKSLATTLLIVGTFLLCWLPICVLQVTLLLFLYLDPWALANYIFLLQTLNNHIFNLLLLNTIMDPIIYAVRIYHIRSGYRRLFTGLCAPVNSLLGRQYSCVRRQSTLRSSLRSRSNTSDLHQRHEAAGPGVVVEDVSPTEAMIETGEKHVVRQTAGHRLHDHGLPIETVVRREESSNHGY